MERVVCVRDYSVSVAPELFEYIGRGFDRHFEGNAGFKSADSFLLTIHCR